MLALVVDDDPLIRAIARRAVERAGADVVEVASADEAVGVLDERGCAVSLVVTDIQMPGVLDGLALAWRLAADACRIPVVVMSASEEALARAAMIPGVLEIFNKGTFDVARLSSLVARVASAHP